MQSQPIAKFSTAAVPTPSKRGRRSNASKQKGAIKFRTIARSGNIDPDGPPPPSVLSMHRPHIGEPQIFHSVFKIRDIPAELRKRSLESKAKTQGMSGIFRNASAVLTEQSRSQSSPSTENTIASNDVYTTSALRSQTSAIA